MSYSAYQYAIALGSDVPLVQLANVQGLLYPYNRVTSSDARMQLGVVSDPPNFNPVRIQTLDAQESSDGIVYHAWDMLLTQGAVSYWLNLIWPNAVASPTGDISTAVTIYTRQHQFANYTRQNCYAIYPTLRTPDNAQGDLIYLHKRGVFQLHQRFNDLVASAP